MNRAQKQKIADLVDAFIPSPDVVYPNYQRAYVVVRVLYGEAWQEHCTILRSFEDYFFIIENPQ